MASPYFLSGLNDETGVDTEAATPQERGRLLCSAIRRAATTLWSSEPPHSHEEMRSALATVRNDPSSARYAFMVLELRVFQQLLRPKRTSEIWLNEAYLPGSQSEHYRDYDAAVVQLGRVLLARLHPSLRNEQPPPVTPLVGYDAWLTQVEMAVQAGRSMTICGASGVGKSALAARVAQQATRPVFWYTMRSTLNDSLGALLFALGHFLHRAGASQLWQLVLASGGTLDQYDIALAALREDLQTLPARPLFCFDELELLDTSADAVANAGDSATQPNEHVRLLAFLEGMAASATMLLIGQAPLIDTLENIQLTGLPVPAIIQFFEQANTQLRTDEAALLYRATAGNPRLLTLCLTLYQRGEPVSDICHTLGEEPSVVPLLQRIRQRLSTSEEALLAGLSVFRRAAPRASWSADDEALALLLHKRLIIADGQGGVEIVPALRPHLYKTLDDSRRRQHHRDAAAIRLLHAEYTAAAYHLLQGAQVAEAIQLWFVQRVGEVQRGQASAAFALFQPLTTAGLAQPEADALTIIQAELHKLRGELAAGLARIEREVPATQPTGNEREALLQIEGLRGEFLELLGNPEGALLRYEAAIQTTSRLLNQQITLHRQRAMLHVRQRDLAGAWQEVTRADAQLQIVRGILADEEGRYDDAQHSFEAALTQAQSVDDQASVALAERHLANTHGRRQDLAAAEAYAHRAIHRYEALGDAFNVARVYDNLAFSYLHAKATDAGIDAARKAHQFFVAAKSTYYSAIVATNLAEAYCDAGDLEQATHYAHQVLDSEERQPLPYALFTLGRVYHQRGDWEHAHHSYGESVRMATANDDKFMEAYARRALGLVLCEAEQRKAGQTELEAALALFQELEIAGEIEETKRLVSK